ncbi:MAG: ABC transporter ATP-binding protein [Chloroflexota bacterium]|nr:ABC transporter ATP-binding protein [Chloroflexota bacterium]
MSEVSFAYSEQLVLGGVSTVVAEGEMVALLGANGSGKSTLLRLLAGALTPTSGSVTVGGREVQSYRRRDLARLVAVLPQEIHVPEGWSVREVVSLGRTPHIPLLGHERLEDTDAVERALLLAECEALKERPYSALSGGQKQRVGLALALAQESRLLLLDEPTAHLDLRYRAAILDTLASLQSVLGITVIAALHDPSLAALYFPRLLLLSGGRLLSDGSPVQVLSERLLEEAYGVPVRVWHDPVLGVPLVMVLPSRLPHSPGRGATAAP